MGNFVFIYFFKLQSYYNNQYLKQSMFVSVLSVFVKFYSKSVCVPMRFYTIFFKFFPCVSVCFTKPTLNFLLNCQFLTKIEPILVNILTKTTYFKLTQSI